MRFVNILFVFFIAGLFVLGIVHFARAEDGTSSTDRTGVHDDGTTAGSPGAAGSTSSTSYQEHLTDSATNTVTRSTNTAPSKESEDSKPSDSTQASDSETGQEDNNENEHWDISGDFNKSGAHEDNNQESYNNYTYNNQGNNINDANITNNQSDNSSNSSNIAGFSVSQVAQHSTKSDCWIILFDKVYDITSLVNNHPGGDVFNCGSNETSLYVGQHGTGLSRMNPYFVGYLAGTVSLSSNAVSLSADTNNVITTNTTNTTNNSVIAIADNGQALKIQSNNSSFIRKILAWLGLMK